MFLNTVDFFSLSLIKCLPLIGMLLAHSLLVLPSRSKLNPITCLKLFSTVEVIYFSQF